LSTSSRAHHFRVQPRHLSWTYLPFHCKLTDCTPAHLCPFSNLISYSAQEGGARVRPPIPMLAAKWTEQDLLDAIRAGDIPVQHATEWIVAQAAPNVFTLMLPTLVVHIFAIIQSYAS
jgi:hypothetical protein